MKKILVLFFCMLVNICACFAGDVKFVQVTDVYFDKTPQSVSNLNKTIHSINKLKDLDFVVFTGNNIAEPEKDYLIAFLKQIREIKVPYYIVIGNKDVYQNKDLGKKTYRNYVRLYSNVLYPSSPNYCFKANGIEFLVIDGVKEVIPSNGGYYKADALKYMDKKLTQAGKRKVVIFQHFPVVSAVNDVNSMLHNVDGYLNILNKHSNVLAVFAGHCQNNSEYMKNGVYHVQSPGYPYYKLVDIERNKIYTQLVNVNK